MPPKFLLVLGFLMLTLALRSYRHPVLQKLGALALMLTSYLAAYFAFGSHLAACACAAVWLLLPWLDLLTRIRKITLPLERHLRHRAPPGSHVFPALSDLTVEVEGEGFEHLDDTGWESDEGQQFFRLFYKGDERLQASICLVDQQDIAFYYLALSSRSKSGTMWTTWNYPFSYSLKLPPEWKVERVRPEFSFLELLESHRHWLRSHDVAADTLEELDTERLAEVLQKELRAEVAHNLAAGLLIRAGESEVRYSWRGLVYLWCQFLRDLVRLT
jgi:hypothetical protein